MSNKLLILIFFFGALIMACEDPKVVPEENEDEKRALYVLPVVVHVIHHGEPVGIGPNLSDERVMRQIEILNEDFRRKPGTRGYNEHPDGADTRIEFVLASEDPEGRYTNGINRIDISDMEVPPYGYGIILYAQYDYWPSDQYINIWTTPLNEASICISLGEATGPETDLPGTDRLGIPGPGEPEGILINWNHFGESDIDCHARYGRTLTHEMGHYLGLLHTWGGKDCEFNDYCDDTPPVDYMVFGSQPQIGCGDEAVMIENYMNWTHDEVMNVFTNDQVFRMHYVLENNPGRRALWMH